MRPRRFMLIAGEASGDALAAELVRELRLVVPARDYNRFHEPQPRTTAFLPEFFGAGGPLMAAAGVELLMDMTKFSAVGLWEVLRRMTHYRRAFKFLVDAALERRPDVIVCVDFFGFNGRFARAIKRLVLARKNWFRNWSPLIVQYVSPQAWASRPGRARLLERTHDLLISIIPFEKEWFAARAPGLRVEFVGHPIIDRVKHLDLDRGMPDCSAPRILLLPGSRPDEIRRHTPIMLETIKLLRARFPNLSAKVVFPHPEYCHAWQSALRAVEVGTHPGPVIDALQESDVAITKSGTVTLECAVMAVPAVVIYRTSWPTYVIAKQLVKVRYLSMPNLILGREVFPELIQHEATPERIARSVEGLLTDQGQYVQIRELLREVVRRLGPAGAANRAANAIANLLK